MENMLWLGILLAILASICLNVGKGVQKWKVKIWGKGRAMFQKENIGDFRIWMIGFFLTAAAAPIYSAALKFTDKSSMVSSLNGVGMIGLVIFAWLVLHEKIGWQEIGGAALVLFGTALMNWFDKPIAQDAFTVGRFAVSGLSLLAVFGLLAAFSWKTDRLYGFSFGAIPGILIGGAMILGDMALVEAGGDMLGQLKTPYPWIAMIAAIGALTVTQLAFWRARAMVVVPTINSFVILAPVVMEYFTFGTVLQPVQYAAIALIVAGVVLLTYTEAQDRIERTDKSEEEAGSAPARKQEA